VIQGKYQPEEACHDYHHGQPLQNIISLEPTDYKSEITPYLPAHDECDAESEKFIAVRSFCCVVSVDRENSNIE